MSSYTSLGAFALGGQEILGLVLGISNCRDGQDMEV